MDIVTRLACRFVPAARAPIDAKLVNGTVRRHRRKLPLRTEKEVLTQFDVWAQKNDLIRAAVLTSSRL